MNKHDWAFVGMRLLGVWFLAQAALGVLPALQALTVGAVGFLAVLTVVIEAFVGWVLARKTAEVARFLGAPAGDPDED